MAIVRWRKDPYTDLSAGIDRFFRTFPWGGWDEDLPRCDWRPAVDVVEEDHAFVIRAELPGLKKDQIEVEVNDNLLTIKGERNEEKEEKGRTFHRVERCYGSFHRSFYLPENVNADEIKASHKDGILELTVPKVAPEEIEEAGRKIEISDN